MTALPLTSGLTLLIVLLMFGTAWVVGRARHRYGIVAPAVTGHPAFERAIRVQMNTLEWTAMTLPCLWLFAAYVSDGGAAIVGGVWLAARIRYARAYLHEPALRARSFTLSGVAFGVLGLGAGAGVARHLLASL